MQYTPLTIYMCCRYPLKRRATVRHRKSPTKRGAYRHYRKDCCKQHVLEACAAEMKKTGKLRGVCTSVVNDPRRNPGAIKLRTLQNMFKKYCEDPKNVLSRLAAGEQRGGSNKIFTEAQERNMAVQLSAWFEDEDIYFTNDDFHLFALEVYAQAHKRTRAKMWRGPSMGMIVDFKKAWGFKSKKPRISHQAKNPNLEAQMVTYRRECNRWCRFVGPDLFFNFDQTFWRLMQNVLSCWARSGQPHHVKCKGDAKAGFSAGVTITASGKLLPIQIIARGKTARSVTKFMLKRFGKKVTGTFTPSGWSNVRTMKELIDRVIVPHSKGRLCALSLDTYACHLDPEFVTHAHQNNVHIIPTPPGGTAEGTLVLFCKSLVVLVSMSTGCCM